MQELLKKIKKTWILDDEPAVNHKAAFASSERDLDSSFRGKFSTVVHSFMHIYPNRLHISFKAGLCSLIYEIISWRLRNNKCTECVDSRERRNILFLVFQDSSDVTGATAASALTSFRANTVVFKWRHMRWSHLENCLFSFRDLMWSLSPVSLHSVSQQEAGNNCNCPALRAIKLRLRVKVIWKHRWQQLLEWLPGSYAH